ncbi:hypothetical protein IWQ55_006184 [Labrenzia sp. EL_208]|nr:hypothetical protein [Labrenzia sp. EL_132]MBG6211550.1 hypothetical protein [Labrenzia sp. EL_126]MBG6232950.1 hypothetical protein [Labrenzia sp. EL_208]
MKHLRKTSESQRRRLKLNTQRTVELCGSQDFVSEITRVAAKTLSDYANTSSERHQDTFMPVDVLADLILDSKARGEVPPLLAALCELAGGTFVRVPEPDRDASAPQLELAAVGARHWAFPSLISRFLAGDISQDEFQGEAAQLLPCLMNDLSQLKQNIETSKAEAAE